MKRGFLMLLLIVLSHAAQAASGIVDTAFVVEAMKRGAIIWDTRGAEAYGKGHIPGAINIGHAGYALRNPNTEDFRPLPEIEAILGQAGVDPGREIVVYAGRGDPYAYFGYYTIGYFGGRKAHIYHDGIDGWRAAGNAVSTTLSRLPPVTLKLTPRPDFAVGTDEVLSALKRPDVQIVDARTPEEFSGDDIRAIRGGHIPGAVNIPYEMNWTDPDTPMKLATRRVKDNAGMALKPREALERLYAGFDRSKETIVYCQSGVRAAQTATVLTQLGFTKVKVYDASWLGYAAKLSAPANNEVFFNVGLLNARIRAMQGRIDQLEHEVAAARRGR